MTRLIDLSVSVKCDVCERVEQFAERRAPENEIDNGGEYGLPDGWVDLRINLRACITVMAVKGPAWMWDGGGRQHDVCSRACAMEALRRTLNDDAITDRLRSLPESRA